MTLGDTAESFDAIYERHVDDVARWITYLGPCSDSEDLVHDVFLIAFRGWKHFRLEARPSTWLYRITLNVVRNHRRRLRFRRWLHLDDRSEIPSELPNADLAMTAHERHKLVHTALDSLPDRHREILVMFEWDELSGEQIAEILKIKVGTVWVRLHRARSALAKAMESSHGHG